jgi:hypothetical protein
MYKITTNLEKNYIHIKTEGELTPDEIVDLVNKVIDEVAKLNPNFVLIHDISKLKQYYTSNKSDILKAMFYIKGKKAAKIIRVIGTEFGPLISQQLNRLSVIANYCAEEVITLEEIDLLNYFSDNQDIVRFQEL